MRAYLSVALAALLPAAANAACEPSFVDGSNVVTLTPSASFDSQQLVERFSIRVQNTGSDACALRLGVGQEVGAAGAGFPAYALSGPGGNETIATLSGAEDNAGFGPEFTVPAGGQIAISYDVRLAIGWGSEAGVYTEDLVFQLFDVQSAGAIASQRTQLYLDIPKAARLRFAGASGVDGPARIDMGQISPTAPTLSPPFALRVLSTSAYRIDLTSLNQGALRRVGGPDFVPYQMTLGGQRMNLTGGGDSLSVGRHTNAMGDVHPLSIVIEPDPTYHAGDYSDRVTVTVTTI